MTGNSTGTNKSRNRTLQRETSLDESTSFGLGGGIASLARARNGGEWHEFLGRPPWLETQFFDAIDVPYDRREGASFGDAWDDVIARIERDDPVLLFLDPREVPHTSSGTHVAPHVVLATGYDDAVVLRRPRTGRFGRR